MSATAIRHRGSERSFWAVIGCVFAVSAAITVGWCRSMSAMAMPMPGGWSMSMAWMPMPGQSWPDALLVFMGMWTVMMVAMMLPSLAPMLRAYRATLAAGTMDTLSLWVALGYYTVWSLLGLAVFPVGAVSAAFAMSYPQLAGATPALLGVVLMGAGAVQLGAWKAGHLACCRAPPPPTSPQREPGDALAYGVRLGVHCACCCVSLTVILMVLGVMDLRAMAVVTAASLVERLAPRGERVARSMGVGSVLVGLVLALRGALTWLAA